MLLKHGRILKGLYFIVVVGITFLKIGDISADLRASVNLQFRIPLLISQVMGQSTSEQMLSSYGGIASYSGALRGFQSACLLHTFSKLT